MRKLLLTALACFASSAAGQDIEMNWWTMDSGAVVATSGSLRMEATIAQPDVVSMTGVGGNVDALRGGYWPAPPDQFEVPFSDDFESIPSR